MVHQHFMLIPVMTVAENIVLGTEPRQNGVLLDERAAERARRRAGQDLQVRRRPARPHRRITVGQQQRVEIMKALYRNADILILDEPTAVLTPQEAADLFEILRTLQREGISIIFISHKLNEVLEIADRITVLRRGKKIETVLARRARPRRRSRSAMVGREVLLRVDKPPAEAGDVLLEVEDLHVVRRPRDREGARRLLPGARRRDRRDRGRRRQRTDGADRRDRRPAQDRQRRRAGRGPRASAGERTRDARRGRRPHPRGPPAARTRARVHDRREHRAARLREAARREVGLAVSAAPRRACARADRGVRRPRRRAAHAGRRALRRQPAESRRRTRDRARSEGPHRRAADARARRRRDRVPPPPDRRRAWTKAGRSC